jgi:hypothetical protein
MNQNNPEPAPPNIQLTPVGFSPTPSPDAVGQIVGSTTKAELRLPVFVPILIILVTLIFSTVRDITALNRRMAIINQENAPALEILKNSGKQTEFVESLHSGLQKLAPTDPVAAKIVEDMFPTPASDKSDGQEGSQPAPAK